MNKITITGKMWNDIVAMQDRLVLLHNAFEDKQMYLTWHVSPWIGLFDCTLYNMENDRIGDRVDSFKCYVDGLIKGETLNDAIDKIIEWEEKYGQ